MVFQRRRRDRVLAYAYTCGDRDFTDEENAWLIAIARWRYRWGRAPTMREAFGIAHALGYRIVGDPCDSLSS